MLGRKGRGGQVAGGRGKPNVFNCYKMCVCGCVCLVILVFFWVGFLSTI